MGLQETHSVSLDLSPKNVTRKHRSYTAPDGLPDLPAVAPPPPIYINPHLQNETNQIKTLQLSFPDPDGVFPCGMKFPWKFEPKN